MRRCECSAYDRSECVCGAWDEAYQEELQQARREGWEQCKYQALTAMRDIDQSTKDYEETFEKSYDAIASMTYKEAQDETSAS